MSIQTIHHQTTNQFIIYLSLFLFQDIELFNSCVAKISNSTISKPVADTASTFPSLVSNSSDQLTGTQTVFKSFASVSTFSIMSETVFDIETDSLT